MEDEIEQEVTQESGVKRDEPSPVDEVSQSVEKWQKTILAAKKYAKNAYKQMREDMQIARDGASKDWIEAGCYTVPIVNRYISQAVAALYAKNPTATAEKRKTLDYRLWDGKPETAINAVMGVQSGDPSQLEMFQDVEQGRQKHEMITRIGDTLEVLFDYYANEQKPRLKPSMKSLVRRSKTCGVAYLMLGFQRQYGELTPDDTVLLADSRNKLGELQRRMQDNVDGEISECDQNEKFEIETLIRDLEDKASSLLREGPKIMFPPSTSIIVDPKCKQLMGFIGAGWIAREFYKTPKEIQKIYQVDLGGKYTAYNKNGQGELATYHRESGDDDNIKNDEDEEGMVCIWEVYNKDLSQTFTLCDGYADFLIPPKEPDYWMEGFWPIFALTFNDVESEEKLFPNSDVHNLKHVQAEYNRSREYRRLHREANKPKYMASKGTLDENDKSKLTNHAPHEVIELNGLAPGQDVTKLLQRFQSVPIDPALYETNSEMEDVLRIVGAQEANIGGTSGATATESSIAEGGRMTSLSSNVDDLDEFLTDVFGAFGQLMIMELSPETVQEIVGIGAVWPEMNKEQVAKQIGLKILAGSSGRPNKAAELANMERGMPYLLQLPGVNPYPLAKRYADLLEIDIDQIIIEGMPSITAMNSSSGMTQGAGTENDPNAQGGEGANNSPNPAQNEPGPQPSYQQPSDNL